MRGVTVCNTPGVNAFAVAEHALTLMLAVGRKITTLDAEMRKNKWPRELLTQLHGKTLGVFGMGTIGARVAASARRSAWRCSAVGPGRSGRIRAAGAAPVSKEDILARADVVSLHVRLSPETRGFLGKKELAAMKPTAILVNTGRGALVDREALLSALKERRIMGAGARCLHQEPLATDDPSCPCPTSSSRRTMPGRPPKSSVTASCAPSKTWSTFSPGSPRTWSSLRRNRGRVVPATRPRSSRLLRLFHVASSGCSMLTRLPSLSKKET